MDDVIFRSTAGNISCVVQLQDQNQIRLYDKKLFLRDIHQVQEDAGNYICYLVVQNEFLV